MSEIKVLHVDDDKDQLLFTKQFLKKSDPDLIVTSVISPREALKRFPSEHFDCVVSDYKMPRMNGIELCEKIKEKVDIPCVLYTGQGSEKVAEKAFSVGIDDYVRKELEPSHFQILAKRIRAVVEKHRAEQLYRDMIEGSQDAFSISVDTRFVYANPAMAKLHGVNTPDDIIGTESLKWIVDEDREMVRQRTIDRREGLDVPPVYTFRIRRKDGEVRTILIRASTILFNGKLASLAFTRDVTEQQKLEEEVVLKSRLLDSVSDSVILHDLDGNILYANEAAAALRGYTAEEFRSMNVGDFISPRSLNLKEAIKRIINNGSLVFEAINLTKDGKTIHFEVNSSFIQIDDESFVLSVSRNIVERKVYERKLELLLIHARDLHKPETIEAIGEATLRIINESFGFSIGGFGVVEEDYIHFFQFIGINGIKPFKLPLKGPGISVRCVKTGESQLVSDTRLDEAHVEPQTSDNLRILSEMDVPVIIDGKVVAVINVGSQELDNFTVNDLRLMEVFANQVSLAISKILQKVQIEEITGAQTQKLLDGATRVTSMVRHDLRSPLQSIRNASHMIRKTPERTPRMLDIIDKSVAYATKILDDLRFIAEPGAVMKENIDMVELIKERLSSVIIPNIIKLKTVFPESQSALVDPTMISRVMDNLIRNAVEAMPEGGKLTIKVAESKGNHVITVNDTGVGMSEEVLVKLFQPFYTTKSMGTGLGLFYAKQAVEAHNGALTVKSKEGKGTVFKVT
ncbi:MAG: PAS domain S-box protein, partial [Candidatus Bathyarchaeota archaeon]|nr:PAS domain S-box protein [Candidatus Bathyarchaeota archaeon]